mmetsp:Transcript_39719/g.64426  ORF Transcript_39719/g.64426 Transcript_39719/m.64426 type:complete len:648 (+) Transcript_39719:90-2033(+)|eukprot:CAMPEP_0184656800 /NCGR_PEP_ID=MMETSP0308-20130426/16742_1 /TAXON_ID=38269 /ORGANISM="Gloeochaete witrockiana, Strain SAG 46.84" /LENGTH=647 /DNA_ID=CAMNT_0027094081 /DNA_START=49 /DNA_END=1992 /DNA_ORIENTATION=+
MQSQQMQQSQQPFYPNSSSGGYANYPQQGFYYQSSEYSEATAEGQGNESNEWIEYERLMQLAGKEQGAQATYSGANSNEVNQPQMFFGANPPQPNMPQTQPHFMRFLPPGGAPYPGHEQVYQASPQAGFGYDNVYQQYNQHDGRPVYPPDNSQRRDMEQYPNNEQQLGATGPADQEWNDYVKLMNMAGQDQQMQQQFMQAAHGISQLNIQEQPMQSQQPPPPPPPQQQQQQQHQQQGPPAGVKSAPSAPRPRSWADVAANSAAAKPPVTPTGRGNGQPSTPHQSSQQQHPQHQKGPQSSGGPHPPNQRGGPPSGGGGRGGGRGGPSGGPSRSGQSFQPTYVKKAEAANGVASSKNRPISPSSLPNYLNMNELNPTSFDCNPKFARFFVIKSYSEDDVHKAIKYNIWASTDSGNRRLDTAWRESSDKGPIYLFYSVNASGQFCGMAQMITGVDFSTKAKVWAQDKWSGQFQVKWIFIKDIPNGQFRQIILTNNENKPVTNSRDTQEVLIEPGKEMLRLFLNYVPKTSILDDFNFYDRRQLKMEEKRSPDGTPEPTGPTTGENNVGGTSQSDSNNSSNSSKPAAPPTSSSRAPNTKSAAQVTKGQAPAAAASGPTSGGGGGPAVPNGKATGPMGRGPIRIATRGRGGHS